MVETLWISHNPIDKVIESVVTGNIGYHKNEWSERFFEDGTDVNQTLEDGRVITGADELNLQWHLRDLTNREVIVFLSEEDARLPLISCLPVEVIYIPSDQINDPG